MPKRISLIINCFTSLKFKSRDCSKTIYSYSKIPITKRSKGFIITINRTTYLNIGEVEQFIMIRGVNINNPLLLLIHGGTPETAHFIRFNKDLENHFIVVYWDQRGEGKSFYKHIDKNSLTLERYIEDIHELTTYLKKEFQKEKLYLLAHSMGTLLGMKTIEKYPDDYISYIAVSQVADPVQSDNIGYEQLIEATKEKNSMRDLKQVKSIDKISTKNLKEIDLVKRTNKLLALSIKYGGLYYKTSFSKLFKLSLLPILMFKEYSLQDKFRALTQNKERILFYYENSLIDTVLKIEVPIIFIHGEDDLIINFALTKEYFEKIKAPNKKFITFHKSAHLPPFEEPEKFNQIIRELL